MTADELVEYMNETFTTEDLCTSLVEHATNKVERKMKKELKELREKVTCLDEFGTEHIAVRKKEYEELKEISLKYWELTKKKKEKKKEKKKKDNPNPGSLSGGWG